MRLPPFNMARTTDLDESRNTRVLYCITILGKYKILGKGNGVCPLHMPFYQSSNQTWTHRIIAAASLSDDSYYCVRVVTEGYVFNDL